MSDILASFSESVKAQLHAQYRNHCAICLNRVPTPDIQSAHLIDFTPESTRLLETAISMRLLTADYERNSSMNGVAQCVSCYLHYFVPNYIALSPPAPALKYIRDYLIDTPNANQMPLYEVFNSLCCAMAGEDIALPDPTPILPYIGIFTIVPLKPGCLVGQIIPTAHLPKLSILRDNVFVPAPHGTSPADQNVVRIFDVLAVAAGNPPISPGYIPLSPGHHEFQPPCYWRLPVKIEAVLAELINRTTSGRYESPEIRIAQDIFHIAMLQNCNHKVLRPILPDPGSGGSSGSAGGRGGNSRRDNKGTRGRDHSSTPKRYFPRSSNRPKKAKTNMCSYEVMGQPNILKSYSRAVKSELSDRSARTSSEPDSEGGLDDPRRWRFGTSDRSDMIIVAAWGTGLV